MNDIASSRKGECLSFSYNGLKSKLLWRCQYGHVWEATPNSILYRKSWCPRCAGNKKLDLEKIRKLAINKGGRCLSRKYINSKTKLLWECKEGHQWYASVFSIKTRNSWCPVCNRIINNKIKHHEKFI
jgi:hypothetical protein